MRIASTPPYHGWSDFRWLNPKTNTIEDKSAWVEGMGDYLVGAGIYKSEQPNEKYSGHHLRQPKFRRHVPADAYDPGGSAQ
jgi:hypothetical protein